MCVLQYCYRVLSEQQKGIMPLTNLLQQYPEVFILGDVQVTGQTLVKWNLDRVADAVADTD